MLAMSGKLCLHFHFLTINVKLHCYTWVFLDL